MNRFKKVIIVFESYPIFPFQFEKKIFRHRPIQFQVESRNISRRSTVCSRGHIRLATPSTSRSPIAICFVRGRPREMWRQLVQKQMRAKVGGVSKKVSCVPCVVARVSLVELTFISAERFLKACCHVPRVCTRARVVVFVASKKCCPKIQNTL